jgi:hypothetical protein
VDGPREAGIGRVCFLQEQLLGQGEEIISKLIDLAKKGDPTALKLSVERLIAPLKPVAELPAEQSKAASKSLRVVFVKSPMMSYPFGIPDLPSTLMETRQLLPRRAEGCM